jgi:hypothetical protein
MTVSNHKTLRPVEVVSLAEKCLWGERHRLLNEHNSYSVRNSYYPHRMDEWHEKEAKICRDYNMRIARLNRIRKEVSQSRNTASQCMNQSYDVYDEIMEIESDTQSEISDVTTDISTNSIVEENLDYQSDDDPSLMFGFEQVLSDSLKFVWG